MGDMGFAQTANALRKMTLEGPDNFSDDERAAIFRGVREYRKNRKNIVDAVAAAQKLPGLTDDEKGQIRSAAARARIPLPDGF